MLTGEFTVTVTGVGEPETVLALAALIRDIAPWMVDNVYVTATGEIAGGGQMEMDV